MTMPTTQPPVPDSALDLLARSDAEVVAATLASAPDETLLHAHLAALRAGAALVQVRGRPGGRPAPRTVWDMVAVLAPELAAWAAFFADNAGTRSAVEAGRGDLVDARRAERALAAAEDFQTAVRAAIGAGVQPQGQLALRAC
jgi:SAV_6107-like HEPN